MKFTVNANSKSHVAWIRYQESISIENRSGVSSFYIIDVIRSEIVLAGAIVITEEQVSILWYHRNARARALLRVCACVRVCVCACACVRGRLTVIETACFSSFFARRQIHLFERSILSRSKLLSKPLVLSNAILLYLLRVANYCPIT